MLLNVGFSLTNQQIFTKTSKRAIFSELFTSILGFRRGRKNLNNEKRIENFISAIAIEFWFASDNHQIRVGSAPMFGNPKPQIAVIQAKIGVSLQKTQVN
jgi:uncharacterized protein (UPF0371 family)